MNFNEYQEGALKTAKYPKVYMDPDAAACGDFMLVEANYVYPALGLVGEAGEVAEKCKKLIRDNGGIVGESDVESIKKELGDVLWYVAVLAHEFGIKLNDVAMANYEKLQSRKDRGVISGSGDNR